MSQGQKKTARLQRLRPSVTIAVSSRAIELKNQGKDIINLGTGEPDFDTPEHIKEAARKAIAAGATKYTLVPGTIELREAICRKLARDNDLRYNPSEIVVTNGAKQSLVNLMMCTVDHGDEVVIPAPCWVSYPDIVSFCGGSPKFVRSTAANNYKINADQLRKALGAKTVMVIFNSPCNPSGAVYTFEELRAFGDVLADYPDVLISTDDIYEHVVYNKEQAESFATVCPELKERTIITNGVSKAYAMTGWRVGFSASPAALAKMMSTVQSQTTSNVCSIAQAAAQAAFDSDKDCLRPMLEAFSSRRARINNAFAAIEDVVLPPIDGAFYAFPQVQKIIDRLHADGKLKQADDVALCELMLEHGVAAVPGSAFEAPGSFRISFAAEDSLIDSALERIESVLK